MKQIITISLIACILMGLGWTPTETPMELTKEKQVIIITEDTQETLEEILEEVEVEFPEATYIWNYLHELGYSDVISAAIIGNMMVECGGYTLNLQVTIRSGIYYGVCQWNTNYYPNVIGCSLEQQCDVLRDSIKKEMDTFGFVYAKGFNYDTFLQMTNVRDAALAFAKTYERCASGSYRLRQNCAENALEYFLS